LWGITASHLTLAREIGELQNHISKSTNPLSRKRNDSGIRGKKKPPLPGLQYTPRGKRVQSNGKRTSPGRRSDPFWGGGGILLEEKETIVSTIRGGEKGNKGQGLSSYMDKDSISKEFPHGRGHNGIDRGKGPYG